MRFIIDILGNVFYHSYLSVVLHKKEHRQNVIVARDEANDIQNNITAKNNEKWQCYTDLWAKENQIHKSRQSCDSCRNIRGAILFSNDHFSYQKPIYATDDMVVKPGKDVNTNRILKHLPPLYAQYITNLICIPNGQF